MENLIKIDWGYLSFWKHPGCDVGLQITPQKFNMLAIGGSSVIFFIVCTVYYLGFMRLST